VVRENLVVLNDGIAGRTVVPREGYPGSPVPPGVPALMLCSECERTRPATKFPTTDPAHRDTECRECRDERRRRNPPTSLADLQGTVRDFAVERDWEQFHNPKNLVMALTGEVGELVELFQWLTADEAASISQDDEAADRVGEEMADVLIYLLRLADVLNLNLADAVNDKMQLNARRYPTEVAKGSSAKYTTLLRQP
jgi:dCTP diphosphatase